MTLPTLILNKDQERRILSGHLWIYSNEIDNTKTPLNNFTAGDLVQVLSHRERPLGIAYINPHTLLCARLLTRNSKKSIDKNFFKNRLGLALKKRETLFSQPFYRLAFADSDLLPGLILDRFGDVIVGQINTAGMERFKNIIVETINELMPIKTFVWKNDTAYRALENLPQTVEVAYGEASSQHVVLENNCEFYFSLLAGQKTGWFYDHRDSRQRIANYVKQKKVLDVFSYIGAFAIPAAKADASQVTCIDSSASALDLLKKNAQNNNVAEKINCIQGDAFALLQELHQNQEQFDVIILDPPAFIKRKKEYQAGLRAYEQLNQLALSLLKPNGILFSASCSMHLSAKDLLNCLRKASIAVSRPISILEQLHQGRDHPIHPAIEETNYLKGFIVIL